MPDAPKSPREWTGHRLSVTIDDYGVTSKLICPDDGSCTPAVICAECGTDVRDADAERCDDCPTGTGECWLKTWADNIDLAQEGCVSATVEFPIEAEFDGDGPVVTQVTERDA